MGGTKIPLLQNYQHAQEFRVTWADEATGTPQEQIVSGQKNVDNLTAQNASCNPKVMKLEKNAIPQVGAGRLLRLDSSFTLSEAIDKVKQHLGLKHLRVAVANNADLDSKINSIGVCAGSGSSVSAGLWITGEMSHHEVLDAVHSGTSVILCEHSNTERGYLKVFAENLNALLEKKVQIDVSTVDADPLIVM